MMKWAPFRMLRPPHWSNDTHQKTENIYLYIQYTYYALCVYLSLKAKILQSRMRATNPSNQPNKQKSEKMSRTNWRQTPCYFHINIVGLIDLDTRALKILRKKRAHTHSEIYMVLDALHIKLQNRFLFVYAFINLKAHFLSLQDSVSKGKNNQKWVSFQKFNINSGTVHWIFFIKIV